MELLAEQSLVFFFVYLGYVSDRPNPTTNV
jgi:hypothetical protein